MLECFICMETDNQLYKVCRCHTVVHARCLHHVINNTPSHSTNCPICRQVYDISTTEVRRCRPMGYISKSTCNMAIVLSAIFSSSFGIVIFISPYKEKFNAEGNIMLFHIILSISFGLATLSVLCIIMVLINHFRVTGYFCCYRLINIVISREINLSTISQARIYSDYADELEV